MSHAHRILRRLIVIPCLAALLFGCATGQPAVETAQSTVPPDPCCVDPGTYPPLLVALAEPFAEPIGRAIGAVNLRQGFLRDQTALAKAVMLRLRPLDIVLTSHEGQLSSRMIPGYLTHALTYLGTPAELTALGVWDDTAFRPLQTAIADGRVFIDAERNGVRLTDAHTVFDNDNVVVLRPTRLSKPAKAAAARGYARAVGGRFDFHFDLRTSDCVFCTELVYRTIPELRLPVGTYQNRPVVFADAIARIALSPGGTLSFVAYARGQENKATLASRGRLAADIAAAWRGSTPRPSRVKRPL